MGNSRQLRPWRLVFSVLLIHWILGAGGQGFLRPRSFTPSKRGCRHGVATCAARQVPKEKEDFSIAGLALVGSCLGPFVDAIHNQALLSYDVLPVSMNLGLGFAKTSLLVPPLLAIAYALLGSLLPRVLETITGLNSTVGSLPLLRPPPGLRAALAVVSTCFIIKISELLLLVTSGQSALLLLSLLAFLQWATLDGRKSSLILAVLAGILGPLAELPLIYLGAWHYITPDYWPLTFLPGFGPGISWAGLSMVTGPCYFAVTTDAIALGRLFAGKTSWQLIHLGWRQHDTLREPTPHPTDSCGESTGDFRIRISGEWSGWFLWKVDQSQAPTVGVYRNVCGSYFRRANQLVIDASHQLTRKHPKKIQKRCAS